MAKATKTGRLYIDEQAVEHLNEMIRVLVEENPYLRDSPSRVASLILIGYAQKYFSKEKKGLSEKLFDKKRYIKHLLSTTNSPEDFIKQVNELNKGRSYRAKKKPSVALQEPVKAPSEEVNYEE